MSIHEVGYMARDVHFNKRKLKATLKRIKSDGVASKHSLDLINDFIDDCYSEGIGVARIRAYAQRLRKIASILRKDFDKADEKDIRRLAKEVELSDYSAWTKHDVKVTIKKFYKWLNGGDEFPSIVKRIKTTMKHSSQKTPEDILTEDDILAMVDKSGTLRNKALIMTLYESGNRISEFLNWLVKDLTFDEYGCKIRLSGKTGARIVRIVGSAPLLKQWLDLEHPLNNNPDFNNSYVWVAMDNYSKGKPLSYKAAHKTLHAAKKKANIEKRVSPHCMRSARATFLANKLTEQQLKKFFGWTPQSPMASHYVFLSGKDVDNAILSVNGIDINENGSNGDPKIKKVTCLKCRTELSPNIKICQCGMPTDPQTAQKLMEKEEIRDKLFKRLLSYIDKDKARGDDEATELWEMLKS